MKRVLIIISIIIAGTWVLFQCLLWAGRPVIGAGSGLSGGGEETQLEYVKHTYGPIILSHSHVSDSIMMDSNWNYVNWGVTEALYRYIVLVTALWIMCCVLLLTHVLPIRKLNRAEQVGPGYPPQGVGSPDP